MNTNILKLITAVTLLGSLTAASAASEVLMGNSQRGGIATTPSEHTLTFTPDGGSAACPQISGEFPWKDTQVITEDLNSINKNHRCAYAITDASDNNKYYGRVVLTSNPDHTCSLDSERASYEHSRLSASVDNANCHYAVSVVIQ